MNVQLPVHMDQDTFLSWVQSREERYELDRGRVVMMTGGSRAHWQITLNLAKALDVRLDPDRYAVLPEFGVRLATGSVRFPDIVVDSAGERPTDLTAVAPIMIAEVLSPSSERIDLGDKAAEYLRLQTLKAYLVIAQDEMKAWLWTRGADDFSSGPAVVQGLEATINIAAFQIEIPFGEIYARLTFE